MYIERVRISAISKRYTYIYNNISPEVGVWLVVRRKRISVAEDLRWVPIVGAYA